MNNNICTSPNFGRRYDYVFPYSFPIQRPQKRTVDEMTPSDVVKQKAAKIKELRDDIKRYKQYIADAEAEIKQWESA